MSLAYDPGEKVKIRIWSKKEQKNIERIGLINGLHPSSSPDAPIYKVLTDYGTEYCGESNIIEVI